MQGVGSLDAALPPDPNVLAFFMNDHWGVARDPLHDLGKAVDPVHRKLGGGSATWFCVGPGVPFGQALRKATGVPQGLIVCGHGGTSMTQWDPKRKRERGGSLYGATIRRFVKNGSRVAGVVWYQGCSDTDENSVPLYTKRMRTFVKAIRRDFCDPALPFVAVQIARVIRDGDAALWNRIQECQRRLPESIPQCAVVPAIDLALDDGIHISGVGQTILGRRLAQAMLVLREGKKRGKPPIEPGCVRVEADQRSGRANVIVEFENVEGALTTPGEALGFCLGQPKPFSCVHRTELKGTTAILHTMLTVAETSGLCLYYGEGFAPSCNVTDTVGRSLPVFGPRSVARPKAYSPYFTIPQVSALFPNYSPNGTSPRVNEMRSCDGKLANLAYPKNVRALRFKTRAFPSTFCSLNAEFAAHAPEDCMVWYRFRFRCDEAMKLEALFGYDGPVRVWLNGRSVFHDPNGTNPAIADAHKVSFDAKKGNHEILFALASNQGRAWGVFLRFLRRDVPIRLIKKGHQAYRMPVHLR